MLKPPSDKISTTTRERLLALADFMEQHEEYGYNQQHYFIGTPHRSDMPQCQTAACVAGFCCLMTGSGFMYPGVNSGIYLELTTKQRTELFKENANDNPTDRAQAIRTLRHFAYTGDIDWSV